TRLIASLPAKTEYIITNVTGQTLLSGHITNEIQQIDVTGLAEGMYFVRIQNDEGCFIKKFCIVR
ncbi:MAG: T9SS type A sorting domain-containing protein, partial [Bacteroidales bacterium]|nr:T9SS type A sorting domain-containing protein [Bacteroidales bacterium]